MFLLSLLLSLSAQDAAQADNHALVFPLRWADAENFSGMAPCSIRAIDLDFAKAHTALGKGFRRGEEDLRYVYLASALIYSDLPITQQIHDGMSLSMSFDASFPKSAAVVHLVTDGLGHSREKRGIVVLLASIKPIDSIECDAFITE